MQRFSGFLEDKGLIDCSITCLLARVFFVFLSSIPAQCPVSDSSNFSLAQPSSARPSSGAGSKCVLPTGSREQLPPSGAMLSSIASEVTCDKRLATSPEGAGF